MNAKTQSIAISCIKHLRANCTEEDIDRFIQFAQSGATKRAAKDSRFKPETLRLLRDLATQEQLLRPQMEELQLQHQLMPLLGVVFIGVCLLICIIANVFN